MTTTDAPRIWVACLAAYNSGTLHGEWIDATDADEIRAGIARVLASSPVPGAEEHAIHDYDGFPEFATSYLGEYPAVATLAAIGAVIESGEQGAAWLQFADLALGLSYIDWDIAADLVESQCVGQAESEAEYAAELYADVGEVVPEWLEGYVDWEALARDKFFQHGTHYLIGGYVFDSEA